MTIGLKYDCWKFWRRHWEEVKDFDESDYMNHYKIVEFTVENMESNLIDPDWKWKNFSSIIDYFRDFKKDNIKNVLDWAVLYSEPRWHTGHMFNEAAFLNRASNFNY